jgi:hypothetical protein
LNTFGKYSLPLASSIQSFSGISVLHLGTRPSISFKDRFVTGTASSLSSPKSHSIPQDSPVVAAGTTLNHIQYPFYIRPLHSCCRYNTIPSSYIYPFSFKGRFTLPVSTKLHYPLKTCPFSFTDCFTVITGPIISSS